MPKCLICKKNTKNIYTCDRCKVTGFCYAHVHMESTISDWGDGGDTTIHCYICDTFRREREQEKQRLSIIHLGREKKKEELMKEYERIENEKITAAAKQKYDEFVMANPNWENEEKEKYMNQIQFEWINIADKMRAEKLKEFTLQARNEITSANQ